MKELTRQEVDEWVGWRMGTGEEYFRNREMDHKDPEARVSVAP